MLAVYDDTNTTQLGALAPVSDPVTLEQYGLIAATARSKLHEDGDIEFKIAADHPHADLIVPGNVVRAISGETAVFAAIIDTVHAVEIGAHHEQVLTVTCKGLLSEWASSPVDPWILGRPISIDRVFNWASPPIDTSGWGGVYNVDRPSGVGQVNPEAWPVSDLFNSWILSRAGDDADPVGDYLFRRAHTLDSATDIVIFASFDNTGDVWCDGTLLDREVATFPTRDGFTKTWRWAFHATAGVHHFGFKLTNWTGGTINPAALKVAVCSIGTDGFIDQVLFATGAADTNWKSLDLPSTFPGFTAEEIVDLLHVEAKARDELEDWTVAASGEFPEIAEFTARVGDTYRGTLDALVASHIDMQASAVGKTLTIVDKATGIGSDKTATVVFEHGTNLLYLSRTTTNTVANAVQAIWAEGVTWRVDTAAVAANGGKRVSKTITLPNMGDLAAVRKVCDDFLAVHSTPTTSVVAKIEPTAGHVPGVDFAVGDMVTVAGEAMRCVGLTWTLAPDGSWDCVPEFDTLLSVRTAERRRAMDRLIDYYNSPASAALLGVDPMIVSGQVTTEKVTWSWAGDIEESLREDDPDALWQPYRVESSKRLCRFEVEINSEDLPDATGDTTIELCKNGSLLNGLYNLELTTALARDSVDIWAMEGAVRSDRFAPRCVEAGNHVDGTITLVLAPPI